MQVAKGCAQSWSVFPSTWPCAILASGQVRLMKSRSDVAVNGRVVPRTTCPHRHVSAELAITPRVSVVIPVLNEAANLPHVLTRLPALGQDVAALVGNHQEFAAQVVLVDGTAEQAVVDQDGDGRGHGLMADLFGAGQVGDRGGALAFQALEDRDLRER